MRARPSKTVIIQKLHLHIIQITIFPPKITLHDSRVTWSTTCGRMSQMKPLRRRNKNFVCCNFLTFRELDILLHLLNWIFRRWILRRCLFCNWIFCVGCFVVGYSVGIPMSARAKLCAACTSRVL